MDLLFGASILASFMAGMVALFAPCCITVLLPAYIASTLKQKKNILRMTFVFFAGIATVLIPIGLGAAWLAEAFRDFHQELWILGGTLMLGLGIFSVLGKGIALPLPKSWQPKLHGDGMESRSVYMLGMLSGAATSCCAPVLAGAMTLAVISGTFGKALVVTFAYVFGMVFPLFLAAYFYDRFKVERSKLVQGKLITLPLVGRTVHSTNLLAALMFFGIGGIMVVLGVMGNAYWSPKHQEELGLSLGKWSEGLLESAAAVPEFVWGALVLGLFGLFALPLLRRKREARDEEPPCCKDKNVTQA